MWLLSAERERPHLRQSKENYCWASTNKIQKSTLILVVWFEKQMIAKDYSKQDEQQNMRFEGLQLRVEKWKDSERYCNHRQEYESIWRVATLWFPVCPFEVKDVLSFGNLRNTYTFINWYQHYLYHFDKQQ